MLTLNYALQNFDRFFDIDKPTLRTEDRETILELEVPGATASDIDISLIDGRLRVIWNRNGSKRKYEREYRLNKSIDTKGITATVKDGLLLIRLPPRTEGTPRQIPVANA